MKMHATCLIRLLWIPLISVVVFPFSLRAQMVIQAIITDSTNGNVLPYVNVYYPASGTGVVSDLHGSFRIGVSAANDTLVFTTTGFRRRTVVAGAISSSVQMQPEIRNMKEVVIRPVDDLYYFRCIDSCRSGKHMMKGMARAAFRQQSTIDSATVELLEAYYNAETDGYDLRQLQLKTGRFGLRPADGHFFLSYENARAITLLPVKSKSDFFPAHPLSMSVEMMRRNYIADPVAAYTNASGDQMLKLRCIPKKKDGSFFITELTMNRTRHFIEEINWSGTTMRHHPFVPYAGDSIIQITWNIHRTYSGDGDSVRLQMTDFAYTTTYKRLRPSQPNAVFNVSTRAVLFLYRYHEPFILPSFDFGPVALSDYRKINVFGYNKIFWEQNREYRLTDNGDFRKFYALPDVVQTSAAFLPGPMIRNGMFEHPYVHWSRKRIRIRQTVSDTIQGKAGVATDREQYEVVVKLFAELDTMNGESYLRTSVVMDPYESYWRLPEDSLSGIVVNVFFDHCEIFRRRLELKYGLQPQSVDLVKMQEEYRQWFIRFNEDYFRQVQRGRNIVALEKYAQEAESVLVLRQIHTRPGDVPEDE